MYMYACMHAYAYECAYLHIYTCMHKGQKNEKERERERETPISALCSIKHAKQKAIVKHRFKLSCEPAQMFPSLSPLREPHAIVSILGRYPLADPVKFAVKIFPAKESRA